METNDKNLLEHIALKDQCAFNIFYKRYAPLLQKWAYRRTNDWEITHEISQVFWENVWLSPQSIKTDEQGCAKNFILHFYTFRILDYLKGKQNDRLVQLDDELLLLDNQEDLTYSHIVEDLEAKEIYQMMRQILAEQPEITRRIFHLRWDLNYSVTETARILQLKDKEIYNRYHRLLLLLRNKINLVYLETNSAQAKPL